jgi:hypothetical protein
LPGAESRDLGSFRNRLGYLTYVQFMVDHGRDLQPVVGQYVPLSHHSPSCPWHEEQTAGGIFSFPPRTQPMHAARRALIAALQVLKQRNRSIQDVRQRDWVCVVAFDALSGGGPVVEHPLGADYDAAMRACTRLQAVGDKGATTATEAGLIAAREHLHAPSRGGRGRRSADKLVVLLTGSAPNLYLSDRAHIDRLIAASDRAGEFYRCGQYAKDAALLQSALMREDRWCSFALGAGLGSDHELIGRMARLGGTAELGQNARASRDPARYEECLVEMFEQILSRAHGRLVQ